MKALKIFFLVLLDPSWPGVRQTPGMKNRMSFLTLQRIRRQSLADGMKSAGLNIISSRPMGGHRTGYSFTTTGKQRPGRSCTQRMTTPSIASRTAEFTSSKSLLPLTKQTRTLQHSQRVHIPST